jgi:hypothetical protein
LAAFSRLAKEAAQKIDALAGETGVDPGLRKELPFQGSYSQTKVEEPVYGGHASAIGSASSCGRPA